MADDLRADMPDAVPATDPRGPEADAADTATAVAALMQRLADCEDQRRRVAADMDNLRKRVARDADRARTDERARVAAEWLPVLDNLDLALEHATASPQAIIPGVQAVREQALAVLDRLGFPRRAEKGEPFDPARHEAVGTVLAQDTPPGTVVHVVRPGYGDDERQLRPASVVVTTGGA